MNDDSLATVLRPPGLHVPLALVLMLPMAGCASGAVDGLVPGAGPQDPDAGAGSADASLGRDAAALADGSAPPVSLAEHLLVTEVILGPSGSEFVEIANLTGQPVALSDYYLSDHAGYARLPAGDSASSSYDFVARFPAGSALENGDVAVIALDGEGFAAAFGHNPEFCLQGSGCTAMDDIDIGSLASLTNGGEPIILFHWDGASDRVADVDIVKAGTPSSSNPMPDKTAVSVDGPDGDDLAASYADDQGGMTGPAEAPPDNLSMKRVATEKGAEAAGGNGLMGHDETSEDIASTWDSPPFSSPTPGALPASLSPF